MKVYLDHAATTALDKRVLKKMLPFMTEAFGNASSLHSFGREALAAVDEARDEIARILHCSPKEIYFTSGGTESDNWAIRGVVSARKGDGKHIVTTKIEHPAVLETCRELERQGYAVTYVNVGADGRVKTEDIISAVRPDTVLVTVMFANNEVGSVQPIAEIGRFCREKGIVFYTDAVQAMGSIPIDVKEMNIDMLGFSAHKFHGPKGVGALYVRSGVKCDRLMFGGEQERGKRAGTLNVPGIVGMAEALRLVAEETEENNARILRVRDRFVERVTAEIPGCTLNGGKENRLVGNANFRFEGVSGEALLTLLDMNGIAASGGSACSSGSTEPSHVIMALGGSEQDALSSVRFSFGKENTTEEVDYVVDVLKKSLEKLRSKTNLFKIVPEKGKYV